MTASAATATPPRLDPRDPLGIEWLLSDEERAGRDEVRRFVEERFAPGVEQLFEDARWPRELAGQLGRLGVLGMHLDGYDCAGRSAVAYGLACLELEAGDSGLRTFVSVQGSLAMTAIHAWGSEEQKRRWLPAMAAGEAVGCFALTEPQAGSNPAEMRTTARRDGADWILEGTKRWIGMGSIADVAVVWARTGDGVRGFLVPAGTPGLQARDIGGKRALRASLQSELRLEGCRLPADALLPGAQGLRGPFTSLNEARFGVAWGVVGAARSCYEAALERAGERKQFGRPIAGFQLVQAKLADMAVAVAQGTLLALHLGRLKDAGRLAPQQISIGKRDNVRMARAVARDACGVLGGDGVTDAYPVMRHMANLEAVATYEGTDEVHTLILGHALTGIRAFA
ncbi:MAG TPA: acyl-CoA dehydrogenase family protein [Solirubrobacteraceae bacterium]|nr:acyl-CoA dehydrogenase family protein [Solirubrobacteraceae bacterium]